MDKSNTRAFSRKQEQDVAKLLNGHVVANSGATKRYKGDVATDTFLIECKTATQPKQSFAIKKEWLEDIRKESIREGKLHGIVAFNFGPSQQNFFIIDEDLMYKIQEMFRS